MFGWAQLFEIKYTEYLTHLEKTNILLKGDNADSGIKRLLFMFTFVSYTLRFGVLSNKMDRWRILVNCKAEFVNCFVNFIFRYIEESTFITLFRDNS